MTLIIKLISLTLFRFTRVRCGTWKSSTFETAFKWFFFAYIILLANPYSCYTTMTCTMKLSKWLLKYITLIWWREKVKWKCLYISQQAHKPCSIWKKRMKDYSKLYSFYFCTLFKGIPEAKVKNIVGLYIGVYCLRSECEIQPHCALTQ